MVKCMGESTTNKVKYGTLTRLSFMFSLTLALTGCAQGLFYFPNKIFYDSPKRLGLHFESVSFKSKDGTRLTGWFIPASGYMDSRKAKGTVIHYHGNAQNLSAHWRFAEWLPSYGYNLFVFDYRGYGLSEGTPDAKGVFEDSNSALDYVRSRQDVNPEKLVLFGQSLGGANAIAVVGAGNSRGVKAVVIDSTFYSYSSIASDKLPLFGSFMDDTFSPDRYIENVSPIPLLLIHGTADTVVSFKHSIKLFSKAKEPKKLILIESGVHIEAFTPRFGKTYMNTVADYIDEAVSR